MELSASAINLMKQRYCNTGEEPKDVFPRVASALGKMVNGEDRTVEYQNAMENLDFLPNSPCLRNANMSNQLKACFVLPVEDSMESIFTTLQRSAMIFKCISASQRMFTTTGIKRAANIKAGDYIFASDGTPQQVSEVIPTGKKQINLLKTTSGYAIKCSEDHKIKILTNMLEHPYRMSKKSEIVFKPLTDICPNDGVLISSPSFPETGYIAHGFIQESPNEQKDGRFKVVDLQLPDVIDVDLAWLLGFFIGDGSYHNDGITFAISEKDYPELITEVQRILNLYDITAGINGKLTARQVTALYKNMHNFFKHIIGEHKHHIPDSILISPLSVRCAFIQGLFDADGTVLAGGYISICTADYDFAVEIQSLLLSLNIRTKIYHRDNAFKGQNIIQVKSANSHTLFVNTVSSRTVKKKQRMTDMHPKWVRGNYIEKDGYYFDRVLSITLVSEEETYNFTIENIHEYNATGIISKNSGGGVGYNFSALREKDAKLSHGGTSSGVMSFIKIYDAITDAIKQGGMRRGASMGILNYDHPEIVDFITTKFRTNALTNFNVSTMVTDEFMKMVETNDVIPLKSRKDRRMVVGSIKASDLFAMITTGAWMCGDPGILFYDRINDDNHYPEKIIACNPCCRKGTLIPTKRGIIPIEEIKVGDEVVTDKRIDGNTQFEKVQKIFDVGKRDIYRVTLVNEMTIDVTQDHKFWIKDKGWITLTDIQKNDKVGIQQNGYFKPERVNKAHPCDFDEGLLIGFIQGDGWISTSIGFVAGPDNKYLAEKVAELLNDRFGCNVHIKQYPNKNGNPKYQITTSNQQIQKYFLTINKEHVPQQIMTGSIEAVKGYLAGLFACDGHIEKGNSMAIALTNKSEVFIHELQILLANLGVRSTIYKVKRKGHPSDLFYGFKNTPCYRLQISGQSKKILNLQLLRHNMYYNYNPKIYKHESYYERIKSVEYIGIDNVYDYYVPTTKSLIGNGICTFDCGEQFLHPYESCCLGSINLSHMVKDNSLDTDKLNQTIETGTYFLMATNKLCQFPIDECYIAQAKYLRIGVGIMGFADMLIQMNIKYDSQETLDVIDKIGKLLQRTHKLAPQSASTLSIAPTGSLSILANCSSGIEPIFDANYERHITIGTVKESREKTEFLRTAHDISPEWHLKVQARWQKYIDNGISKTINMSHQASVQDVRDVYVSAWKMGCKGVTVYRDGCRDNQVYRKSTKCEGEDCHL
jgi:ribonucleoside-diphosphate reductase alpha chain